MIFSLSKWERQVGEQGSRLRTSTSCCVLAHWTWDNTGNAADSWHYTGAVIQKHVFRDVLFEQIVRSFLSDLVWKNWQGSMFVGLQLLSFIEDNAPGIFDPCLSGLCFMKTIYIKKVCVCVCACVWVSVCWGGGGGGVSTPAHRAGKPDDLNVQMSKLTDRSVSSVLGRRLHTAFKTRVA